MVIGIGDANVAGLSAIGAVIHPVYTQARPELRLAEAAVSITLAFRLGLIALAANGARHSGRPSFGDLNSPIPIVGQPPARDKQLPLRIFTAVNRSAVGRYEPRDEAASNCRGLGHLLQSRAMTTLFPRPFTLSSWPAMSTRFRSLALATSAKGKLRGKIDSTFIDLTDCSPLN